MASLFPKIDTLEDVLGKITVQKKYLDKAQKDKLMKLKFNGENLLSLKNRAFILDIIGLFNIIGFEEGLEYINNVKDVDSLEQILKKAPPFKEARLHYYLNLTAPLREKATAEESLKKCKRCGGRHVTTTPFSSRRADEAITEKNFCRDCGYTWIGG